MIEMSYRLFGDKTVSISCDNNANIVSTIKRKVDDICGYSSKLIQLKIGHNRIEISLNELKQEIESFGIIYHTLFATKARQIISCDITFLIE